MSGSDNKPKLLIFSNCQCTGMAKALARSKVFSDMYEAKWLFTNDLEIAGRGWDTYPADYMEGVEIVWEQIIDFVTDVRQEFNRRLPQGIRRIRFPTVLSKALWPHDVGEPRRPGQAWYLGHSDRLAIAVRGMSAGQRVSDAEILKLYADLEQKKLNSILRLLEIDRDMASNRDEKSDVKIGDFIADQFHEKSLFSNGIRPTIVLYREILQRLVSYTFADTPGLAERILADIDPLLDGFTVVDDEEVPISPLVAERLSLKWFQPDRLYRWRCHRWTRDEWLINVVRLHSYVM
jgi:hypothetical protein